jgi:hypothetical protein
MLYVVRFDIHSKRVSICVLNDARKERRLRRSRSTRRTCARRHPGPLRLIDRSKNMIDRMDAERLARLL